MRHCLTRSVLGCISQAVQAPLQCQLPSACVPGTCYAGACSQQQRRLASDSAAEPVQAESGGAHLNATSSMDFPGGRVPFTDRLTFVGGALSSAPPMSCYRTLDSTGACRTGFSHIIMPLCMLIPLHARTAIAFKIASPCWCCWTGKLLRFCLCFLMPHFSLGKSSVPLQGWA